LDVGSTRTAEAKTTQMGDLFGIAVHVLSQKKPLSWDDAWLFVLVEDDRNDSDNALNHRQFRQGIERCCVTKVSSLIDAGAG
jgi:hypothetical protein